MANEGFGSSGRQGDGASGNSGARPSWQDNKWLALTFIPIVGVMGTWLVVRYWPNPADAYAAGGVFLLLPIIVSVIACVPALSRGRAQDLVLPAAVGALITRIGLAPILFAVYSLFISGTLLMSVFFGPFGLLGMLFVGAKMAPVALVAPVMELIWGEICAFVMWRDDRLSPVAAIIFAVLQLVPVVGLVAVVIMVVMGRSRRSGARR